MTAYIGGSHLQLKEQFSLAEPSAILEEPFASYLKLEVPHGVDSESTLRCTLNAALVLPANGTYSYMYRQVAAH